MQGKGSNPLKVLIKENKVIYQSINQLNSGWCHTVIKFQLYIYIYIFYIYIYIYIDAVKTQKSEAQRNTNRFR